MTRYVIRSLRARHIDAIVEHEARVEVTPWSASAIADTLVAPYESWVVTLEGKPVAWLLTRRIVDRAELLLIGTAKDHQRKGLARRLLTQWERNLRVNVVVAIHLEVRASNVAAQALYQAMGYERVGRRKNYYFYDGQHEDALLWTRQIQRMV